MKSSALLTQVIGARDALEARQRIVVARGFELVDQVVGVEGGDVARSIALDDIGVGGLAGRIGVLEVERRQPATWSRLAAVRRPWTGSAV